MKARKKGVFYCQDMEVFRKQAFSWAQSFTHHHYFNPNRYHYPDGTFLHILAAGCSQVCNFTGNGTFETLFDFHQLHQDWIFGYITYDVKNEIEALTSRHADYLGFPAAYFYIPRHVIHLGEQQVCIETLDDPETIYHQILSFSALSPATSGRLPVVNIHQRTSKDVYIAHVHQIKNHILEGDVYELNYCMEFFAPEASIDPFQTYIALNQTSPMPFSVFQRIENQYVLCASPERFLKKQGTRLCSQPIKGTARRGSTTAEDTLLKEQLRQNEKEMAENMMIVDLVRNDLARSAETGTVQVEEMFGIYTFPQLHQMISTVTANMRQNVSFPQAIKHAFPMGSMTGAPKIKAMELIDRYELAKRGMYSGTIGYITPDGDFDFNVVIRSILYNASKMYLSFQVGSAITYDAIPEQEYEECMLKAGAMLKVLQHITGSGK